MSFVRSTSIVMLALALASCGKGGKHDDLNALDAALTNNGAEGQIVVDTDRIGGATARLPALKGEAAKALAASVKLAGGKLLATPAPAVGAGTDSAKALSEVAMGQQGPGSNANCRKQLVYGNQWASRLPDPFTPYPGSQLVEAAGAEKNGCTLRAATFVTPVPRQSVMDFYYTQARRSGFDAEHRIMDGDHVLGGMRKDDGSAYFLLFTDAPGGKTSVDVIADNGR